MVLLIGHNYINQVDIYFSTSLTCQYTDKKPLTSINKKTTATEINIQTIKDIPMQQEIIHLINVMHLQRSCILQYFRKEEVVKLRHGNNISFCNFKLSTYICILQSAHM